MSKVAIKGNASGTGTFTLEAPNSNTDRTLNLPDEAGTVITSASDIESQVKTATNATGSAPIYACRAWVNFNGTGTVAIRDSGNVSSITDLGTGNYRLNFSVAFPDTNYSVTNGQSAGAVSTRNITRLSSFTTTTVEFDTLNSNTAANQDTGTVCAAIFR